MFAVYGVSRTLNPRPAKEVVENKSCLVPVAKGDLLVASNVPGYAKASAFVGGAVIGKALENHNDGYGVIEVLVIAM